MLYLLHRSPQHIPGGTQVVPGLYSGGDMTQAVRQLKRGLLHTNQLRCLLGYCGWDAGELEAEIAEGSWLLSAATWQVAFEERVLTISQLWDHLRS
jgi:putative transcriptional regulator